MEWVGVAICAAVLITLALYPGQVLAVVGLVIVLVSVVGGVVAKTVFHEIYMALGITSGILAFGLGVVIMQLVAIRAALGDHTIATRQSEAANRPKSSAPPPPPNPARTIVAGGGDVPRYRWPD